MPLAFPRNPFSHDSLQCFAEFSNTVAEVLHPGPAGGEPPFAKTPSQAVPGSKSFKVLAEEPFVGE